MRIAGPPERDEHAPERRPARRAVDARGLEQRARRRDEERAHPERAERDRQRDLRQDQRPVRVGQARGRAGRSRAARSAPPRGPSARAGTRRRAPSRRGSASARTRSRRGSRARSRSRRRSTATIALERRYDEKWPCVHASEKFEKCRPDGRWKPGRVARRAERRREDPEHRVQRDEREDDQDHVVQDLLAPRDHVCPRSAMRVIANAITKMTQREREADRRRRADLSELERAVVDLERRAPTCCCPGRPAS